MTLQTQREVLTAFTEWTAEDVLMLSLGSDSPWNRSKHKRFYTSHLFDDIYTFQVALLSRFLMFPARNTNKDIKLVKLHNAHGDVVQLESMH